MTEFAALRKGPGEELERFMTRVDEAANKLGRVGESVDEDTQYMSVLNHPTHEYVLERHMLEGEALAPSRGNIEIILNNPYLRLQREKGTAGAETLVASVEPGR